MKLTRIACVSSSLTVLLLLVVGCTSPSPEPTPTEATNGAVCGDFTAKAARFEELAALAAAPGPAGGRLTLSEDDELNAFPDVFAALADRAEGNVGKAVTEVADVLETQGPFGVVLEPDLYFAAVDRVVEACQP